MADDKSLRGQQDRTRIDIHERYELRYWSEKFGVSTGQLKAVVAEVGPAVQAVEARLRTARES